MSKAARSVWVYGFYILAMGVILTLFPNRLLDLLGVAETDEVWIRVLGVVAIALGYYYLESGRTEAMGFVRATVAGRLFFFVGMIALALGADVWQLVIFGAVDLVGGAWTWRALLSEA